MDINLLTKMLTELVLRHDKVGLPGLGTFVAEEVSASFSDNGFTVNPPYRKLSFNEGRCEGDHLVEMYARINRIDKETAEGVLSGYINELKETIQREKCVILPGLGKLRATRFNDIFFVPDENLDIFPEGFGLTPVSMKSHTQKVRLSQPRPAPVQKPEPKPQPSPKHATQPEAEPAPEPMTERPRQEPVLEQNPMKESEETQEPVQEQTSKKDNKQIAGPEAHIMSETKPEPAPEKELIPEEKDTPTSSLPGTIIRAVLIIFVVLALFLAAFIILAKFTPDFIDSLLYTAEERAILNYPL